MSQAKGGGNDKPKDGRDLVISFVSFTQKVLQEDMQNFFETHMDKFDQDEEELTTGRGETFEQYDVFKKYEKILDEKIEGFCRTKGFESSRECFTSISDAINNDKDTQKKLMAEIQASFAKLRSQIMGIEDGDADTKSGAKSTNEDDAGDDDEDGGAKADAKGDAKSDSSDKKSGGGSGIESKGIKKDSDADSKVTAVTANSSSSSGTSTMTTQPVQMPLTMFFPPMPLDRMLEDILSLTEYTTFSYIMRNKVREDSIHSIHTITHYTHYTLPSHISCVIRSSKCAS